MFRWLVRQSTIQQYFVYLFWLIKVKFFEKDSDPENESFLLRGLSVEYVKILELLASHGHGAEYEKDFAYQYLPYILANAVYSVADKTKIIQLITDLGLDKSDESK